jgi:two-component system KDP operon response regulator KdpE
MKILAIDDDPAMIELLKLLLRPTHATVLTADTGAKGIQLTKDYHPEVVILDIMMPEMDGWQVCEAIRKFSDIPILVLSALDNPGLVVKALDAGADDYLVKPVPSGILIAHINNLVRRAHSQEGLLINIQK